MTNISSKLKAIENKLRKDDNLSGQIDYNEQVAWLLFLKSLDMLEKTREKQVKLSGKKHEPILDAKYRWASWVHSKITAEERFNFIKEKLLPYMRKIDDTQERELIASVFQEIPTKFMKSPYALAEVIQLVDELDFRTLEDSQIITQFYEESLQKMGTAGRQAGGEFYTPRPLIRFIVKVLDPKPGETILDPFMGSAGFLVEAFQYLKSKKLSARQYETLQSGVIQGQEKKPVPFLLGVMNMLLHDLYGARLTRGNTFARDIRQIKPDERVDVVMTNPPFGGEEEATIQENFPYPTSATQVLAVQYILRRLKPGGRCGMVVDEGFLSRINERAFANTKKELITENNLFAIVSLPQGGFTCVGTGVKTNLIFFERGKPTKDIWYYELTGKFSKGKPIKDSDMMNCWKKFQKKEASGQSWIVSAKDLKDYDLTAKNPNRKEDLAHKSPEVLVTDIEEKENIINNLLGEIKSNLAN
ncbi:MAG: N-6 DNA methylase [Candidatus Margulisiibacteriota bacterium]